MESEKEGGKRVVKRFEGSTIGTRAVIQYALMVY